MKRWKRGLAALLAAALLAAVPAGAMTRSEAGFSDVEWEMLKAVNRERLAAGVYPVSALPALQRAAHIRRDDLVKEYRHDHTRPNGDIWHTVFGLVGIQATYGGENIAGGFYGHVDQVTEAWMNSPGHRENMLDPLFGHAGMGHGREYRQHYGHVWEQLFYSKGCQVKSISVEPAVLTLESVPASLEDLDLTITVECEHGTSVVPLLEGMYALNADGSVATVRYRGITTTLPITCTGWRKASPWAEPELHKALEQGILPEKLRGGDLTLDMSRGDFAGVIMALYEKLGGVPLPVGASPFTDTADPAVLQANALGIVHGIGGGLFAPDAPLTREQAAVMLTELHRALGGVVYVEEPKVFRDGASIAPWAAEAVDFMAAEGIILGDQKGNFLPQTRLSREAALLLALRMGE